jgi:peptidoglycan/xylan/chitin deacetylase (PgdA/CDA1 family)
MKRVTLSFDNGPTAGVTPGVLDCLALRGIAATFFVSAKDILEDSRRALVRRAKDAGHRIGNHTYSHSVVLGESADPETPALEIGAAQEILGDLSEEDRLYRPYGGGGVIGPSLLSRAAIDYLCAGGYTCVLWNSVPRDWEDPTGWPERAFADIARQDWTLVVVHDIATGAMKQLPRFLDGLRREGLEIVQDFPPDCVPIRRGRIVGPVDHLASAALT